MLKSARTIFGLSKATILSPTLSSTNSKLVFPKSFSSHPLESNHPEGTEFKGEDLYGNKYYEAPKPAQKGKHFSAPYQQVYYQKSRRWVEPPVTISAKEFNKLNMTQKQKIVDERYEVAVRDVPPEWESWLRGRRVPTPTIQEQARSARIAMKASDVLQQQLQQQQQQQPQQQQQSDGKAVKKTADDVQKESVTGLRFPVYEDYELNPNEDLTDEERIQRRNRLRDRETKGKDE